MDTVLTKEEIGYFLKRTDIHQISVVDLIRELHIHIFEANIIKLAIENYQYHKLSAFDCAIGDWKCQTRTSMIIDYSQDTTSFDQELSIETAKINKLLDKLQQILDQITKASSVDRQKLTKTLQNISIQNFFQLNNLNYTPPEKLKILSLSFFTTVKNHNLPNFQQHQISVNKIKSLIIKAKIKLCELSIKYEQQLAKLYNTSDEQIALNQIEHKSFQYMTSLFSGFKGIFSKMKEKQQPFIIHNLIFCSCGGIQKSTIKFFAPENNTFKEKPLPADYQQGITIIEAYQFPGSLEQLQDILSIPHEESGIPKKFYKPCHCAHPTNQEKFDSIEEAIMAFFAQHPQFTNNAQIDFEGLGLSNSNLKKEYDYLLTLKGFSRKDMSKFHINHMYPSTITELLEHQKEIEEILANSKPE